MKILQTPIRFYPYTGGVENHVYDLSKVHSSLGHEVEVVCAREPKDLPKKEVIDGLKVKRLPYYGKIAKTNIIPSLPLHLHKKEFDIIHTHLPTPWNANFSSFISTIKNKPLVLTYHNDIIGQGIYDLIAKLYNKTFLKTLLRNSDRVIITQQSYIEYSPHLNPFEEKIEIVPNGVDLDRFEPNYEDGKGFFFLSVLDRYHKYKGLDVLLRAFKLVLEEVDTTLTVGGSGELLDHYKKMARDLDIEDNVRFVGYIPEEDLPKYYKNSKLFVLPSLSSEQEGFGMVLLEAMASGLPVVTTDVVGVSDEILNRECGIVLDETSVKKISNAIVKVLTQEDKAVRMGKRGRELVEKKFDWEKIGKETIEIYEEVLE